MAVWKTHRLSIISDAMQDIKSFSGQKGSPSPHSEPDNMFSTDVVEVLLAISEGPIKGNTDGAKSQYAGDTPFRGPTGDNNVGTFDITCLRGSHTGENIVSKLGGFGSSTSVGVQLAPGTEVIRQGTHTHIDYLDLRLAINRLAKETTDGSYENTGRVRVRYRKVGAPTWTDLKNIYVDPLPDEEDDNANKQKSRGQNKKEKISRSPGDRTAYWQSVVPSTVITDGDDPIWFDSNDSNRPKHIVSGSWQNISGASHTDNIWTWTAKDDWGDDKNYQAITSSVKPKNVDQGDFWLRTSNTDDDEEDPLTVGVTYLYNGNTFVIAGGSLSPGGFGTGGSTVIEEDGIINITGRITSTEIKEYRIPIQNYNGLYEIWVENVNEPNTTELFFDVTWESFQEVTAKVFNFPDLATTQIVVNSSDQFSSIPDFWGIYDGRVVKVPSNYDPETRVYSDFWDGTWKIEYTNNPAYVGYDLVNNDRYGMNAYYPITLDEQDVYAAGQWCDEICADGKPRFTFNGLISNPLGGREAINYVFGVFGGRFFDDGNGKGVIKIDDQSGATQLFGPENVEDGVFIYSFTDIMSRSNDITVSFINPDLDYNTDRRRIYDQDHIDKYGRIPLNFEAIGCTDEQEAVRRARYRLITSTTEIMTVSFKTNRKGLYLSPYEVILIADEDMGYGLSGRIKDVTNGRTNIVLRDPITLENGFNYTIAFSYFNGVDYELRKVNIVNGTSGSLLNIPLQSTLPSDLPAYTQFSVERRDGTVAPKAFRVISIGEVDNDPDKIEIQALEINRNKWLYIDGYVHSPSVVDHINLHPNRLPDPPEKLRCKAEAVKSGRSFVYTVSLDWDRSPSKLIKEYWVYYSRNNGPMTKIGETRRGDTKLEIHHVKHGDYVFQVVAVNHKNRQSDPVYVEHRLKGNLSQYDTVENLRLIDNVGANKFNTRIPTLAWNEVESGAHEHYVVQIRHPDTKFKYAEYTTKNNRFQYHYDDNIADHSGTPARRMLIRLYSEDNAKRRGDPTDLIINNPAPGVLENIHVEDTTSGAFITFKQPDKRDYLGVMVHASTSSSGFTPNDSNLKYKGPSNSIRLPLDKFQTWYIKIAAYDAYSTSDLNYSSAYTINTDVTVNPDEIPDGAVTSKGTLSVKNKKYVSFSDILNWSGNVAKTKYTETVILDTFIAKNPNKNPIQIDGNITLIARLAGTADVNKGTNVVQAKVILEHQAPGSAYWSVVDQMNMRVTADESPIQSSRLKADFDKFYNIKASGDHKFRLKLVVFHKKAYSGGITTCDIIAHGNLDFVWLKK